MKSLGKLNTSQNQLNENNRPKTSQPTLNKTQKINNNKSSKTKSRKSGYNDLSSPPDEDELIDFQGISVGNSNNDLKFKVFDLKSSISAINR